MYDDAARGSSPTSPRADVQISLTDPFLSDDTFADADRLIGEPMERREKREERREKSEERKGTRDER